MQAPGFTITLHWTLAHLLGYLNTWSAVQHYIKDKNENPVESIEKDLQLAWGNEAIQELRFPVLLRVGTKG